MGLLDGKNQIQHWAEALTGQDDLKGVARTAMLKALEAENAASNGVSTPARKVSRPAMMVAGAAAGITAASAAVSAYRHSHSSA